MKKHLLIAASLAALLASCTSEVIPERPSAETFMHPIEFSATPQAMTRGLIEGEAAATRLGNEFVVYGKKHVEGGGSGDAEASGFFMPGYVVEYANEAWEYSHKPGQKNRYWADNATKYTFAAYSNKNRGDNNVESPKIIGNMSTDAVTFTVPPVTAEQLGNIHFTPLKTVLPANFQQDVALTFSNAAAKIRVAFYNTIPGYDVQVTGFSNKAGTKGNNVVFYTDGDAYFVTTAQYTVTPGDGVITYVMESSSPAPTKSSDITLGDGIVAAAGSKIGGPNITSATFDKSEKGWTYVHPQPENNKDLILKISYFASADGDTHEEKTHDVIIPATYAKWKPNYAYTYFFKITDSDLHPIVFTADVEEFKDEETITTVDPSNEIDITTYLAGSNVFTNDQYLKGNNITVTVTCPSGMTVTTEYAHKVITNFETETHVTESNCAEILKDAAWTTLGTNVLNLAEVGYYVIRVKWTKTADSTTGYAYKVITVKPQPSSGS